MAFVGVSDMMDQVHLSCRKIPESSPKIIYRYLLFVCRCSRIRGSV